MLQNPLFYGILAALCLLIFLLKKWSGWRKKRKQFEEMSQLKRRDEALNEALRNPGRKEERGGPEVPMEISWDDKAVRQGSASTGLLIELVELSAYSRRKYVFRAEERIQIGSGDQNAMSLPREGVAEQHCEICLQGGAPCVRSLSRDQTILKRKKQTVLVSEKGVYLKNGDRLQLGSAEIQFRMFKG